MTGSRSAAVDWLRAIGIFLIVYGHSGAVPVKLNWVIFAFHVPLFFFLSGYVTKKERLDRSFRNYAAQVSWTLLPAYLFFALVGFFAWFFVLRYFGEGDLIPVPPERHFGAIFYGSGSRDDLLIPVVLWFFPCLYVARLLLWPLVRLARFPRLLAVLAFAILGIIAGPLILPWELESAFCAIVFIWGGYEFSRHRVWSVRLRETSWIIPLTVLIAGIALSLLNARVDLRLSRFGNPLLYYAAAFSCVLGLYGLCARIPATRIVQQVSASTLIIFPLHPLVFSVFTAIYVFILELPPDVAHHGAVGLGASLLVVIVLTIGAPVVQAILSRWWIRPRAGRSGAKLSLAFRPAKSPRSCKSPS